MDGKHSYLSRTATLKSIRCVHKTEKEFVPSAEERSKGEISLLTGLTRQELKIKILFGAF